MSFADYDNDIVKFLEAVAELNTPNDSLIAASREILEKLYDEIEANVKVDPSIKIRDEFRK